MEKKVLCLNCKHYYVTWDKNFPKGCRLFKMKSAKWPYQDVKRISDEECSGFFQKDNVTRNNDNININISFEKSVF